MLLRISRAYLCMAGSPELCCAVMIAASLTLLMESRIRLKMKRVTMNCGWEALSQVLWKKEIGTQYHLKWRTGLKHQTGKCEEGNPQIIENIWFGNGSAKPDLVVVVYCKRCFVSPGIFEPSSRTWVQSWASPIKTGIQKMREIWKEKNWSEKFSKFDLWGKLEEIRLFCSRKKKKGQRTPQ